MYGSSKWIQAAGKPHSASYRGLQGTSCPVTSATLCSQLHDFFRQRSLLSPHKFLVCSSSVIFIEAHQSRMLFSKVVFHAKDLPVGPRHKTLEEIHVKRTA